MEIRLCHLNTSDAEPMVYDFALYRRTVLLLVLAIVMHIPHTNVIGLY